MLATSRLWLMSLATFPRTVGSVTARHLTSCSTKHLGILVPILRIWRVKWLEWSKRRLPLPLGGAEGRGVRMGR